MKEAIEQVDLARKAFEQEFERFDILRSANGDLTLAQAEILSKDLAETRIKHTGKKSQISGLNRLIGQAAPEERASVGKLIQTLSAQVNQSITDAENTLKTYIENAKTERERLDVTLPGRRVR